jgi:hypothetical protein
MIKNYEGTKYPKIFQNCYWGKNKNEINDVHMLGIFENRNNFIEQFKIKKILNKSNTNIRYLINQEFNDLIEIIEKDKLPIKNLIDKLKYSIMDNSRFNDHVEVYETYDDKIIILASPYIIKDDNYNKFLEKTGFIHLSESLYGNGAISFYKIYNKHEVKVQYITNKVKLLLKNKN